MPTIEVTHALEPVSPLLAEGLEDLLIEHWQEVEQLHDEMPLDVDWPKYLMLERMGIYKAVVARRGKKLIGYAAYFLQPPLHHSHKVWAVNDVLYLDPAYRKGRTGDNLIGAAEGLMRDLGAHLITQEDRRQPNSTATKVSATLGDLLLRRGYFLAGRVFAKLL
jgi:GNAT superfamily N-acetyltransferase